MRRILESEGFFALLMILVITSPLIVGIGFITYKEITKEEPRRKDDEIVIVRNIIVLNGPAHTSITWTDLNDKQIKTIWANNKQLKIFADVPANKETYAEITTKYSVVDSKECSTQSLVIHLHNQNEIK